MAAPTTVKVFPLDPSRTYPVDFDYLSRDFVKVFLLGADRLELVNGSDFEFISATQIRTFNQWSEADGYTDIEIRRDTSTVDLLVDFNDASILRATDLNISALQTIHIAEEARNLAADTLGSDDDGNLDARGKRIINVLDPVDDLDVVNKRFYEADVNSIGAMRDQAVTARNQAQGFAQTSSANAVATAQDRVVVESARDTVVTARDQAVAARDITVAARDVTTSARDVAVEARDQAVEAAAEIDVTSFVRKDGATPFSGPQEGVPAVTNAGLVTRSQMNTAIVEVASKWLMKPLGEVFPLWDHLTGCEVPPTNDTRFRYVKLTGTTGAVDAYNVGVLGNAVVSGVAPSATVKAPVVLTGSPMLGANVELINSSKRFIRPGPSGVAEDSQNLSHNHTATQASHSHTTSIPRYVQDAQSNQGLHLTQTSGTVSYTSSAVTPAITVQNNGGDESRPNNIGATYYMRVK